MQGIIPVIRHALMVTGFVAVMMLVIEYVNVLSQGQWQEQLSDRPWGQYFLAAFLGATPGCLGAFAVVAMYTHRRISLGAVVAAMVATSGDESFVMFAMIPRTALLLTLLLFVIGIAAGALTDRVLGRRLTSTRPCCEDFSVHGEEDRQLFAKEQIVAQWKACSAARGILALSLLGFMLAIAAGELGPPHWNWIRITLLLMSGVALFIVSTVPEHFLEDHLWKHVVQEHAPRVFLWTFGALLALHFIVELWQIEEVIKSSKWIVLAVASMVGLVPESGPHLVFVTLFEKSIVPFSVLLASSVVQDGHGMLPLLAHSRREFLMVKLINLVVGLAIGAALMVMGA
ncbi:MAG: arsenic efflux protein [Lentisphaeria bacterium]|nr:arsenic efflux protein [Lentisphaeria bacterium]